MANSNRIFLYSLPLALLVLFFIAQSVNQKPGDFAGYYFGSIGLIHGNYEKVYDTYLFNLNIYDQGYRNIFVSYTPFPPFTSVLLAPFTVLPLEISKIVFNLFCSLLFIFTLHRCIKHFSLHPTILLFIPLIFFTPIRNNIYFGQSYLLLFVLLMEGYFAYKNNKDLYSSILWGTAIVFKIFPAVIIIFLLVRKEYWKAFYLALACLILTCASLLINGYDCWKYYLTVILPRLNNGELNDSFTYMFQSAFMLLKNIFIHDDLMNPESLFHNPFLFSIVMAVFKGTLLATAILITKKKSEDGFESISFWILISILISPNGSTYSLILLLIPYLAILLSDLSNSKKTVISILLLLICNIPVHYFRDMHLLLKFPRLYLLLALFTILIIKNRIRLNYKLAGTLIILFTLMESIKFWKIEDKSKYLFSAEKHILIYDYSIQNNTLMYSYWTEEGKKEEKIDFILSLSNSMDAELINNQIYYKRKKITDSPDRKKKPMLVNGNEIIYLSDKNRGVGFYTLRKIRL